jgi:putative colanic acid biosynthesis acetyltransferase WcaF
MSTAQLNNYNNSWYHSGASKPKQLLWYFVNALIFDTKLFPINKLKIAILKLFGAKIGKGVVIKPSVNIKYPWRLTIGDYSWIGENVWIDNLDNVTIGSNCCISQGALLLCGNHNYKTESFDLITKPIVLEDGVWIGAKSVLCPGVHCFSHAILTVGSVATKNLEANTIYQGNPATANRQRV